MASPVPGGRVDLAFGVAFAAAGLALLWETAQPQYADTMGLGVASDPAFYPRILIFGALALSAVLLANGLLGRGDTAAPQRWGRLAAFAALVAAYAWAIVAAGFLFASIGLCLAAPPLAGYRRHAVTAAVGIAFPLGIWFAFTHLLGIPLPSSPWFHRI
ncbi:MAG: tripartite tricarboxylate transporter TctB family protein [Alphaproteobacteria bacterium]